jgi:hypothetical protein
MSGASDARREGGFRLPATALEFWALALALLVVFVLIQFGAPFVRDLDFLDQKLRDYFIGISFAAFPLVHRECKRGLAAFTPHQAPRTGLAPWYVTGVVAAAVLFGWNQFVSFLGGLAAGLAVGQLAPTADLADPSIGMAVTVSIMAVSLPLSAVAAVFAGVILNRNTRSHVFAALALAAFFFVSLNAGTGWYFEPTIFEAQVANAAAEGAFGLAMFAVGVFLVGVIIFVFGAVGVVISWFNRERAIGRIMEGARRLPAAERELLVGEIARRLDAAALPPAVQQAAA